MKIIHEEAGKARGRGPYRVRMLGGKHPNRSVADGVSIELIHTFSDLMDEYDDGVPIYAELSHDDINYIIKDLLDYAEKHFR